MQESRLLDLFCELVRIESRRGTGEYLDYDVQAVYRAIGYFGSPLAEVPFAGMSRTSSSGSIGPPSGPRISARSSVFLSWRTLPGQRMV